MSDFPVPGVVVIRAARPRPRQLIRVSQLCSGLPCPRPERALAGVGGAQGLGEGGVVGVAGVVGDGGVRGGAGGEVTGGVAVARGAPGLEREADHRAPEQHGGERVVGHQRVGGGGQSRNVFLAHGWRMLDLDRGTDTDLDKAPPQTRPRRKRRASG